MVVRIALCVISFILVISLFFNRVQSIALEKYQHQVEARDSMIQQQFLYNDTIRREYHILNAKYIELLIHRAKKPLH